MTRSFSRFYLPPLTAKRRNGGRKGGTHITILRSLGSSKIVAVLATTSICILIESARGQPTDPRDPYYQARRVFVGSDRDMPLDGTYVIAIQPEISASGQVIIPSSIIASLREMRHALPHWFLQALKESKGDHACSVTINNSGYIGLVGAWMWMNWVKPNGSPLMAEFARLGAAVRNDLTLRNALINGLCELVKTDDENHAMEYLAVVSKFELVQ